MSVRFQLVQRGNVNKNEGLVVETEVGSSERLHNLPLLSFGKEGNYTSFTYFSLKNLFFFRLNYDYMM